LLIGLRVKGHTLKVGIALVAYEAARVEALTGSGKNATSNGQCTLGAENT
jgi:hypothetical protein